jgi:outer membrane lipoprotein SlyB
MSSTPSDPPSARAAGAPKAMWAAIGALGVAVVAMGGLLLHQQGQGSSALAVAPVAAMPPVQAPADFKPEATPPRVAQAPVEAAALMQAPLPPVRAPDVIPAAPMAAAGASMPPPPVVAVQSAPLPPHVCATCGRVESVQAVHRQVPASGVGAVAGGVLGGVLGHQIGNGNGRTAATILGAVGGGLAGNEVEKRTHTVTVYEVDVRMQNGALRHVETSTAPPVGKAVTLQSGVLKPADANP